MQSKSVSISSSSFGLIRITRDDFVFLYRFLCANIREGRCAFLASELCSAIEVQPQAPDINYIKLRVMIKVMQEMNLLSIEQPDGDLFKFSEYKRQGKADLEKSNLLRRLRSQLI